MNGSFVVDGGDLASAVHYAARWLAGKPMIAAHGGLLFEVVGNTLTVSGFNENATARAFIETDDVDLPKSSFVVAGRLIDQLAATFGDQRVKFEREGSNVAVTVGRGRWTLPAMSEKDYPALPGAAELAGHVDGAALADAVQRVGAAASRDLTLSVPMCGILVQVDEEPEHAGTGRGLDGEWTLTLMATNRYRASQQSIPWVPDPDAAPIGESFLVLASTLLDAAGDFAGDDSVAVGWQEGLASLTTPTRSLVVNTLDKREFPAEGLGGILRSQPPDTVTVRTKGLDMPLRRVGLLLKRADSSTANAAKVIPMQVNLTEGLMTLVATPGSTGGGDEEIDVEYDGPDTSLILNADYLQTVMKTAPGERVTLAFRAGTTKPIIVSADGHPTWRHLLQPLRDLGGKQ
jgi:DNA polymerase III sliding clamp (beta) subunit (PCNA family)